jgi:ABC-type bacteriocin/lantibiotic exporter with double-glycine peptidase domain
MRWLAILGAGFALMLPLAATASGDEGHTPATDYDCGTLSLSTLLSVAGKPADLAAIEAVLPPPKAGGYSMLELREAANRLGLPLRAVAAREPGSWPERPAIALLGRGEHGHFVVVRPVGHTNRLVQVIDSNAAPRVVDLAELMGSPEWTGRVLVSSSGGRTAAGLLMIASGLVFVATTFWRVRSPTRRPASAPVMSA